MSSLENELQDLREKNNELVKKVQYWKMTAAQKENEKLELMKETNELRLKLSRLRSGGDEHARKLDAAIQSASEQAISHLVQASNSVTRTVQLVKTYMQERQELETVAHRWSSISNTPSSERVHRVPPLLIGGQPIQPVVSLSRTMGNINNLRSNRSPNRNQNRNFPERAVPMHVLQDFSILLTRIDANDLPVNNLDMETDADDTEVNNSTEDLGLDDSTEQALQESPNISDADEFDDTRRLDPVTEDVEPESQEEPTPRPRVENPLEGPSWMLDGQNKTQRSRTRVNLEPDSTTECDDTHNASLTPGQNNKDKSIEAERGRTLSVSLACEFSPTVRRRKRASSPAARRNSNNGRILKVLVSKLRLDEDEVSPPKRASLDSSPRGKSPARKLSKDKSPARKNSRDGSPKRQSRDSHLLSFDAPSPNGATTSHVIVSESLPEAGGSGEPAPVARRISKHDSSVSRDTKHDSRDRKHDNRDKKHDIRTSRDDRHDSRASRDEKHDSRTSRDDNHDSRGSHTSQDSDSGSGSEVATEGRTRRPRKAVTYKEKPLNRKMRR